MLMDDTAFQTHIFPGPRFYHTCRKGNPMNLYFRGPNKGMVDPINLQALIATI
jgi:hypothetical protein